MCISEKEQDMLKTMSWSGINVATMTLLLSSIFDWVYPAVSIEKFPVFAIYHKHQYLTATPSSPFAMPSMTLESPHLTTIVSSPRIQALQEPVALGLELEVG